MILLLEPEVKTESSLAEKVKEMKTKICQAYQVELGPEKVEELAIEMVEEPDRFPETNCKICGDPVRSYCPYQGRS